MNAPTCSRFIRSLTYDANGNILTDKNGNSYLWDALNRLMRISYAGEQKLSGTIIGTSGSNGNSGNVIANAFDGNTSTYFDGPTADGCWLGLDLGTSHPAVTQIKYTCRAGYGSRMVGGQFQISSASDFSSGVVTLATITTAPSDGVSVAVPIVGATELRYVRYLSPSGSYGDIAELEFDGSISSEFAYDGLSRRVQIVEKSAGGGITSTKNYLWVGQSMAEERSTSNSVAKRFFPQGEQQSGTPYYYTRDHLGSVREMISSTGTIFARYSYDDYGRKTYVQGSGSSTFEYAGMYFHANSGLNLTLYRAYDANTGRWLSRDPWVEGNDFTLYSYVWNDPVNWYDPLGLAGGGGLPQNGFGGAKNGSPGNPNGIDPAIQILNSPTVRSLVGAGSIRGGAYYAAEGAMMCEMGNPWGLVPLAKGGASFMDGLIDYWGGLSGNGSGLFQQNPNSPSPTQPSPTPGRHSGPGYTQTPRPR